MVKAETMLEGRYKERLSVKKENKTEMFTQDLLPQLGEAIHEELCAALVVHESTDVSERPQNHFSQKTMAGQATPALPLKR